MVLLNNILDTLELKVSESMYSNEVGIYCASKSGFLIGSVGNSIDLSSICNENENSYFNSNVIRNNLDSLCTGKVSLIETISVESSSRGSGLGSKLLEGFISFSIHNHVDYIVLVADVLEENNFDLVNWYSRFGFKVERYWDYSGYELPIMILHLK